MILQECEVFLSLPILNISGYFYDGITQTHTSFDTGIVQIG